VKLYLKSVPTQEREFTGQLQNYYFFRKNCVPWF